MRDQIMANPIFIQDKFEHDTFCSDGEIVEVNKFDLEVTYRPCKFCERIDAFKKRQMMKAETNGN